MSKHLGRAMRKIMPTLRQERPEMVQKLTEKMALPFTEIIADVTKISKPV
jgi:hypothetical protein